jgi:hypothetical protein
MDQTSQHFDSTLVQPEADLLESACEGDEDVESLDDFVGDIGLPTLAALGLLVVALVLVILAAVI